MEPCKLHSWSWVPNQVWGLWLMTQMSVFPSGFIYDFSLRNSQSWIKNPYARSHSSCFIDTNERGNVAEELYSCLLMIFTYTSIHYPTQRHAKIMGKTEFLQLSGESGMLLLLYLCLQLNYFLSTGLWHSSFLVL